jgi:hypothetical protein
MDPDASQTAPQASWALARQTTPTYPAASTLWRCARAPRAARRAPCLRLRLEGGVARSRGSFRRFSISRETASHQQGIPVTSVAAGAEHSVAATADGKAFAWGWGEGPGTRALGPAGLQLRGRRRCSLFAGAKLAAKLAFFDVKQLWGDSAGSGPDVLPAAASCCAGVGGVR